MPRGHSDFPLEVKMMKTLNAEQAMLPAAKANRPDQLAGQGLALALLLLLAIAGQPAAASCGGTTTVGTQIGLINTIINFESPPKSPPGDVGSECRGW
jgi:hypothetical protein